MVLNFQNNVSIPVRRVLLTVVLVLSLVMITVYVREGSDGPLHTVQKTVGAVVAPLKYVGATASSRVGSVGEAVQDATADDATLSGLRDLNAQLVEQLAQTEEYRLENERLREMLTLKDAYKVNGVGARVIGRSTDAWNQTVTIDVGEHDGIDTGLTVLGSAGVVGQIVSATASTATVRLLADPQSGAAAIIQSNRAEGIVRGSLDGLLYLESVDDDVAVNVGDLVLTSGLGGSYTRGLLIGQVVKVEGVQGGATRRIVVSPNSTVDELEEVLVVLSTAGTAGTEISQGGE